MSSLRTKLHTINQKLDSHGSSGDLRGSIDEITSLAQAIEPKAQNSYLRASQLTSMVNLEVKLDEEKARSIKLKLASSDSALQSFSEVWISDPLKARQSSEFSSFNRAFSNLDNPLTDFINDSWNDWVEQSKSEFAVPDAVLTNSVPKSSQQQSNTSKFKRLLRQFMQLTECIPTSSHDVAELKSVIEKLMRLYHQIISDPGISLPSIVRDFYEEADKFYGRGFELNSFTDELWNWLKEHGGNLDGYTIKRR